jgi:uncharacterized membrane protein (UPF0182 family)
MMDAFTTSDNYPYSRHYRLGRTEVNYIRNSVKVVVNAYDGSTSFCVFDGADPMIAAYRTIFPTLFKDASAMPADLRRHVRYPELQLELQAAIYGLYHMTNPEAPIRGSQRRVKSVEQSKNAPAAELRPHDAAGETASSSPRSCHA